MDMLSALASLGGGMAMKVPQFAGGYVKRDDVLKADGDEWDQKYKLTFVPQYHGGTTENPFEFVIEVYGGVPTVSAPVNDLVLDAQLFSAMMFSTEWVVGTAADFEAARTSADLRW